MAGEARFTLAPLALADAEPAGSPAVQLFAEPRAARPDLERGVLLHPAWLMGAILRADCVRCRLAICVIALADRGEPRI